MAIVTLTTDWQNTDFYAAIVKAKLLSFSEAIHIVDISHTIPPFNILNAAFVLEHSYLYFPKGTIHIICVGSEQNDKISQVIVKANNQYFIGSDNGLFSLLFKNVKHDIFKIQTKQISSFPCLDTFVPAAIHLISMRDLSEIAMAETQLAPLYPLMANYDDYVIEGQVVYIDSFGNAICNISKDLFVKQANNRRFDIFPSTNYYKIKVISDSYHSVEAGEMIAFFNTQNLLELAINKGKISELINLSIYSTIRIVFYDN